MSHFDWKLLRRKKVIPAERRVAPGKELETWTLAPDCPSDDIPKPKESESIIKDDQVPTEDSLEPVKINREHESRKSRAKKVKNYLRKCKGALSSTKDDSNTSHQANNHSGRSSSRRSASSSWYLEDSSLSNSTENRSKESKESSHNILPARTTSLTRSYESHTTTPPSPRRFGSESLLDSTDRFEDAVDFDLNKNEHSLNVEDNSNNDQVETDADESQLLAGCSLLFGGRGDVASLVRCLLGPIYGENVLDPLTRQARDILVCAYHGNLESFVESYLVPASQLLAKVKSIVSDTNDKSLVPDGWPLTLAGTGLVLQLGELGASALRHGECYLCVRSSRQSGGDTSSVVSNEATTKNNEGQLERIIDIVEIALIWRSSMRSPGILAWEREDDFMDWRETSALKDHQQSTNLSPTSTRRRRIKSKEDHQSSRNQDISPSSSSNSQHHSNVPSPLRVSSENSNTSGVDDNLPKLPAMRLDQRQSGRQKEETKIQIEDLKRPSCLESVINNRHQKDCPENLSEQINYDELTSLIGTLLVTVERKIERVNLDDLVFPCPACRNIDTDDPLLGCKCSGAEECSNEHGSDTCDCGIVTENCRSFEVAGIKHIDSDDEEEVRMGFGSKRKIEEEVPSPRSIHDLPERVLHCGLRLQGYADDLSGRLVLEFDNTSVQETKICPREIASYLLYLSRLHSSDRTKNGWTLVIRRGTSDDFDTLDRALVLVQGRVNVRQAFLLRNSDSPEPSTNSQFPRSRVKITSIDDATLSRRIPRLKDGDYNHEEWIAFYKEYDSLMTEWQNYGRQLVMEMSELKDSTNIGSSLTPLSRLLTEPESRRTLREASECLASLEERAETLSHLDYVSSAVQRARRLMEEVGNAATRLENSFESRRATIRNFAVLRTIEEQAREVLSWLCKKGEDILNKHARHAATTLTTARLHERDFEKFYFSSMRHLDKGSDLAEAAGTSGLNDLALSLREHLRDFGLRLEDRREYLEDTSRCCLLQDQAQEWMKEARAADCSEGSQRFQSSRRVPLPAEHLEEMMNLAEKLGNEALIEQCRVIRNKCLELVELTKSNSAPQSPSGLRRSFARSESAAEYNSWDDDSNAGSCPIKNGTSATEESQSATDNIVELGETRQQDNLDSPPRSPATRRLVKPPVNSHLQRSPSIAPAGMKAKKTILLIMREMIQTERDYVKSLEYIIENYIPELVREDIPQALRGQRNVIFGNVEKIYEFHSQHFLRELEQCEHSPMMVGQCFLRHENKFYLYALYNKNKPNSDSLMAEYGSSFFKAKQLELGDKMDLASYLLKPVQRMGKYALLLQQLVKAGTDLSEQLAGKNDKESKEQDISNVKPIVEGEAELRAAEQMVRFQLRHGNDLLAMDSLRDCDVNVKEQGRLLRQNEFLVWQGKGKKCLRQVFLFEDLILFSKARRFPDRKNLDIYIYKHSIKTTDIGLTAVIADSPTKFEIWFRKRKPGDTYTLQCASEEIKKAWTEELSNLLWKQALRNREVRLAEMSSMGIGNKPCLDIRPSADQINDRSISVAQLSKTPRFRNSIAVSISDDSNRCSRRPHSVISVSSSSSSGGSSGVPQTTLHLGLDASPRLHHRSTTLNSQCSVESGIIADISIVSDDGVDGGDRSHWKQTLESPTSSHPPNTSTPLQSPTSSHTAPVPASTSSTDVNLTSPYDQDMSINL
ncbi:puratrophin-1-like isoform X2 [Chelonus insularis]|uniref:puratrophin-1-like isoform X2 n=1 Tax=Chelonus insularis TaxID=460826 RepID=UPI00158ED362|nr:puratrophin-1-like isoform X2 [Chelonus insularis]